MLFLWRISHLQNCKLISCHNIYIHLFVEPIFLFFFSKFVDLEQLLLINTAAIPIEFYISMYFFYFMCLCTRFALFLFIRHHLYFFGARQKSFIIDFRIRNFNMELINLGAHTCQCLCENLNEL